MKKRLHGFHQILCFFLKTKILQSLPLLCAKNLLNTSMMGKVALRIKIYHRKVNAVSAFWQVFDWLDKQEKTQ
ncbi:MAG: hypothetical protein E7603_10715 [Ruminococcaceae bacterium]|nr:hypothetical protein [Oscillospiraceae bacterium]